MSVGRIAVVLLGLLATARVAGACTCAASPDPLSDAQIMQDVRDQLGRSVAVFTGRVNAQDTFTVTFDVDSIWKGQLKRTYVMRSGTERTTDGMLLTSTCDFPFKTGETYIVFASGKSPENAKAMQCGFTAAWRPDDPTVRVLDKVATRREPSR